MLASKMLLSHIIFTYVVNCALLYATPDKYTGFLPEGGIYDYFFNYHPLEPVWPVRGSF